MSTQRKDGGPAFPTPCNEYGEHSASMSLRDWFAGQALARLVSGDAGPQIGTWPQLAAAAYDAADAMLAARNGEEQ